MNTEDSEMLMAFKTFKAWVVEGATQLWLEMIFPSSLWTMHENPSNDEAEDA